MNLKPYPMQYRGADRIVKDGATYLMWEMGLGKTLTCILAMKKLGMPVFVLAPLNAAIITWPDELDKWAPDITYTVLHGPSKEHKARNAHNFDVIIMNFEGLYWWLRLAQKKQFKLKKFFVVWDESSMLKNSTTKRWQIMAEAMPIWSPYRVCLSGTPMPSVLEDLWGQYYLLDEGKALCPEIYQFRNRWFDWDASRYKSTIKQGAEAQIYDRIAPLTDRMGDQDWMNLPEVVHNDIVLELPPKLRKVYTELETEFYLEFPNGIVEANSSGVLDCKLRQFMQGALYTKHEIGMPSTGDYSVLHDLKIQQLQSTMDTSAGHPVLAPVQFKFEYDLMCKRFKYEVPLIAGRTPATRSAQLVREWNEGKHPLLVVHPRSVAYSLNMQFGGHIIFWVALPWEMDLYKQLIRRLRRQGQKAGRVIVHRAVFADTVDTKIAGVLAQKDGRQENLFAAMIERSRF